MRIRLQLRGKVSRQARPGNLVEMPARESVYKTFPWVEDLERSEARQSVVRRSKPAGARQTVPLEEMARGLAAILWPASTLPLTLALWRMGQDLGFAANFFVATGLFSRWQIWFGIGLVAMAAAYHLNRWAPKPGAGQATSKQAEKVA